MNVGLIARAENRGLGIITWEFFRHVRPAKTLVVDPGDKWEHGRYFDRYPGGAVVQPASASAATIDGFLDGLDVVYTAETAYFPDFFERARRRGVRTVVHVMPEYAPWTRDRKKSRPDVFWVPTPWRAETLPQPLVHVPVPVDRQRIPFRQRTQADVFVHTAGSMAPGDRNGTRLVLRALRYVRERITVVVRSQVEMRTKIRPPRNVELVFEQSDVTNYWDMYRSGDVLLHPRRYGGLSMPLNEAMSSGMAIISTDLPPQNDVLLSESLVPARPRGWIRTQKLLFVPTYSVSPRALAATIDRLARDPHLVQQLSKHSDACAEALSWDEWEPRYRELLAQVL